MVRRMTATEARVHFGEMLDTVQTGERVEVTKRGKHVVTFMHPAEYVYLYERRYGREAALGHLPEKLHRYLGGVGWDPVSSKPIPIEGMKIRRRGRRSTQPSTT
jgi:prevent-host-death family protein